MSKYSHDTERLVSIAADLHARPNANALSILEEVCDLVEAKDDRTAVYLMLEQLRHLKKKVRELEQRVNKAAVEDIKDHGPLITEDKTFTVARQKRERLKDRQAAADEALAKLGGDFTTFMELLSSNPFKVGSVEQVLGKDFRDRHWDVEWKEKVVISEQPTALREFNQKRLKEGNDA